MSDIAYCVSQSIVEGQVRVCMWKKGQLGRDVSGVALSTGKLQGVVISAIDPLRASAQGF